ncbi:MAG TPA: alpha/beta hydrolase [Actinobacteria bacterium]|nr:alpha/beta hydrolase [Actinomycetota bacterium]
MDELTGVVESKDGTVLFTRRWPASEPRATILVVHGLGEHSGRYRHVGSRFAAAGYETVAFDLRGHGRSGGPRVDVDDFRRYLEDLDAVHRAEVEPDERPWVLYGHSMGGLIAVGRLVDDAARPAAAVLSAPALSAEVAPPLRAAAAILGRFAGGIRFPSDIRGDQLSRDPAVGEAYFADPLVETKVTARFGRALFAEQARLAAHYERIDVPTLVLHGADDELVRPEASAPLAAVETVERKLYPGLRHEPHNEPEGPEVLDDVVAWLDAQLA